jgi:hypothetical protein
MPRNDIPTAPKPPGSGTDSSSNGTGSGSGSGKGSGSGSGDGSKDPYAYAKRQQKRAEKRANEKYLEQVATLQQQVRALEVALGSGFKHALDIKLANVDLTQRQQDNVLMDGYHDRVGALRGSARDTEKDAASQSTENVANRGRERMNAMSEALASGAGESDLLRAQEASLRNWEANQGEINRSYHDTLRSINSSMTDLTTDTRTARANNVVQSNADREQLWTNYYNQRSEAYTQLGNVKGMQADYLGMADEAVKSGHTRRRQDRAQDASGDAFMDATRANSRAWENPGVGKKLMGWDGAKPIRSSLHNSAPVTALTTTPSARPEGATLRKW